MDKKINFTGGEPDINFDDIKRNNEANRDALFAIMKAFNVGANENFIISGADVTIDPGVDASVTAGFIFLNGEIVKVDAQNNVADGGTVDLYKYVKSTTFDPNGDKTFNDSVPRQTWEVNRGTVTAATDPILSTELDILGDRLETKIKRSIKGSFESATDADLEIAIDTTFVEMTHVSLPSDMTLTIPKADETGLFFNTILVSFKGLGTATLDIEDTDTTNIISLDQSSFVLLINDGSTWTAVQMTEAATAAEAIGGVERSKFMTASSTLSANGGLITKVTNIGDWDMQASSTVSVAHGLSTDFKNIRAVSIVIRDDADTLFFAETRGFSGDMFALVGIAEINSTNFVLAHDVVAAGLVITNFNATSFNRGWVTIHIEP